MFCGCCSQSPAAARTCRVVVPMSAYADGSAPSARQRTATAMCTATVQPCCVDSGREHFVAHPCHHVEFEDVQDVWNKGHKPVTRRTRSSVGRQERILRRGLHDARARRKRNLEKNATQRTTLHITRVAQYPSRENTSTLGGQSLCYTCTKHGNDIPHRLACDKDTFLQRRRVLEPSTAANSHTRTVPA